MRTPASDLAGRLAPTATGALAGAAVAVQLAGGPGWLVALSWALAAAATAVQLPAPGDRVAGPGHPATLPARVLLVVAAAAAAAGSSPALLWTAAWVLVGAVLVEPLIAWARPAPDVVQLAGIDEVAGGVLARVLPLLTLGAIAVAALVTLVAGDSRTDLVTGVWVAAGALAGMLALSALWLGLSGRRHAAARTRAVRAALERHAPTFALYTGRDDGGVHQILMWLPYLERLGEPYLVVTRSVRAQQALAAVLDAPVYTAASWRDLDPAVVPSLRAAFYVSAAATNTNFVGYRQMCHVYLGHGESDKASSFHPSHSMYDRIFVAGPAAIDRYRDQAVAIREDAFVVVGRPQAETVSAAEVPPRSPSTALYAPTWSGYSADASHSSLPVARALVEGLLAAGLRVLFRPHPFSLQRPGERPAVREVDAALSAARERTGVAHVLSTESAAESLAACMNQSDLMVCDVSSVLVDYLPAGKPLAVVSIGVPAEELAVRHPSAGAAYVVPQDLSGLPAVLADVLGPDPLREQRAAALTHYLGGLDGPAAVAAFLDAARRCIVAGGAAHTVGRPSPTH